MLPCTVIDFFFNNQPDAIIIQNLFCYKSLHVSGIFSAHRQALVNFMKVFDDRFQAESEWNCSSILTLLEAVIKTCMKITSDEYTVENS